MGILISLGNWSAKSRKRILQNAIFIVNDKCAENSENDLFPLFRIRDTNGPLETGKAIGTNRKLWKSYREIQHRFTVTNYWYIQQFNATHGLPSVKDSKKRRQRRFSAFFSFNSSHQFISKRMHSSAFVLMLRSAQNVFLRHESISRIKREKETLKSFIYSRTHEFATSDARPSTFRRLKWTF